MMDGFVANVPLSRVEADLVNKRFEVLDPWLYYPITLTKERAASETFVRYVRFNDRKLSAFNRKRYSRQRPRVLLCQIALFDCFLRNKVLKQAPSFHCLFSASYCPFQAVRGYFLLAAVGCWVRMAPERVASTGTAMARKAPSSGAVSTNRKCPFKIGDVVWARLTNRSVWWPGIVIDPRSCGYELSERVWVLWLGDQRLSDVEPSQMKYIVEDFNACFRNRGSPSYHDSVRVALELFFMQLGLSCPNDPVTEALSGFSKSLNETIRRALDKNDHKTLPTFIQERLDEILSQADKEEEDEHGTVDRTADRLESIPVLEPVRKDVSPSTVVPRKRFFSWPGTNPEEIYRRCVLCSSPGNEDSPLSDHPFFFAKLCENCQVGETVVEFVLLFAIVVVSLKRPYKETYFVVDQDGKKEFCALCGSTGVLVVCESPNCSKTAFLSVYCTDCISTFGYSDLLNEVLRSDPWHCFNCSKKQLGILVVRPNWEQCLFALFNTVHISDDIDLTLIPEDKQPIRVLSLFDGLATGKVILDLLGLQIERYYCCEIDPDAMLVSRVNHPMNVEFLGDVRELSLAKLEEISPVDLLIGGSPCNDKLHTGSAGDSNVAVSDPEGTGILFFEYYRVLQNLLLINAKAKRNLFWLFENVASMRDCYKTVIDRFLGVRFSAKRPPALYDSRFFSPQNRARYFWGNIPGMYQANRAVTLAKAPILDDILTPNCGRKSKMARVRTITTRSNSLKQGRTFSLCPVEMDGRPDILWPTEIERLFGLPVHYTDVGGLPPSKRQKLIGQGWTIPVVKHIMRPLQNFFKRTS
ncbi:hypothetical protein M513_05353 [Trichuris suis]|uniref:DNA (cytosine-5-)-methyltransferase n=1 Tax=Trichuris suis TaxID=68888 RepID=A0A085M9F1_9BILA|nr:hypothetical protein M513_05353 [Trichuris suis]